MHQHLVKRVFIRASSALYCFLKRFWEKSKKYRVRYNVTLKNCISQTYAISVVVPLPLQTHYQRLLGQINFDPQPLLTDADPLYDNHYALWTFELQPSQSVTISYITSIEIFPRSAVASQHTKAFDGYAFEQKGKNIYLAPNAHINGNHPKIRSAVTTFAIQRKDFWNLLTTINNHTIETLSYGDPTTGLYSVNETVKRSVVDCGGFSTYFASLAAAVGINARLVAGFFSGAQDTKMHAWVEVQAPSGQWIGADPTIEHLRKRGQTRRCARLGFLPADRIALSVGCDIPITVEGQTRIIDLLQHPYVLSKQERKSYTLSTQFITEELL